MYANSFWKVKKMKLKDFVEKIQSCTYSNENESITIDIDVNAYIDDCNDIYVINPSSKFSSPSLKDFPIKIHIEIFKR